MNKLILLLTALIIASSCSVNKKPIQASSNVKVKPEIPIEILNKMGIASYSADYKKDYPRLLPYLFYNENDVFNGIQGDFYNLKNDQISSLGIMPGYWREYGKHKNSLIVLISMPALKEIPVTVESSKYGVLINSELRSKKLKKSKARYFLFVKKIEIENDFEIINKIYGDIITVTVGDQGYKFLNPELEIK